MKTISWIVSFLLLAGCASVDHNKKSNFQPTDIGSNGFIVISTFADDKSIFAASTLVIRQAGHHRRAAILQIDNFAGKSDFSPGWGFLYSMPIAPGDYVIELGSINSHWRYKKTGQDLGFTVTSGKNTYLGEAYFFRSREEGKTYGHIQMVDKASRDIPLFLSRVPAFSADMVETSIPHKGEVF